MSHLLAISVGPVQEFIAAARRTRDLWFGSDLLSEISCAVAQAVEAEPHKGKLIFPARSDAGNVANVILAELPGGDPKAIAAKAKEAAKDCWEKYATQARKDAGNAIRDEIWDAQVKDVIEFYAAWVPHNAPLKYPDDRKKLMRLLAGRKACRDFESQHYDDVGVPKSSLDGQRPSVFVQPAHRSQRDELRAGWPKALRLSSGEELDVVGVTKRLGKKPGESNPSYASVARVAADTWLRGIRNHPKFEDFKTACSEVPSLNRVAQECYEYFPFEGTVVYKDRHSDLIEELGPASKQKLESVAKWLKEIGGEPNSYLAVLVADGDRMGAAIADLGLPDAHREFSNKLAGFANAAKRVVESHNGVLVYAGGDDVLAFLPVDKALQCARDLHGEFEDALKNYKNDKGKSPTLSVGIAIGHFMENLEDLLEYGRAAEKAAKKPDRDGLAVHLHKRGGAPIRVRARWRSDKPDNRLMRFAELILLEAIPSKLPYDLRKLADHYDGWKQNTEEERRVVVQALRQDVIRVIHDKQPRSGRQYLPEIEAKVNAFETLDDLKQFVRQLLVARQIASALKQAGGEK